MNKRMVHCRVLLAIAVLAGLSGCGGGGGSGGAVGAAPKTGAAPTPDFSRSLTNPFVGQSVQFTDLSTGNPTSWSWDFNDDGTEDSNVQNPSHMYMAAGVYSIKLTATNQFGSKSVTKTSAITVHVPLVANFTASAAVVTAGTPVQFTDTSTGTPTAWQWDFNGDLVTDSTAQNPIYIFATLGPQDVRLTVQSIAGSDTEFKAAFVTVNPPAGAVVDIDVDANRNGVVESTAADDLNEEIWNATQGAVYYYNLDDDDNNDIEDYQDSASSGADLNDLSRIIVRQCPAVSGGGTVTISVSSTAQGRIRIFRNNAGNWSSVYSSGPSFTLPAASVAAGDIELGIEARDRMSAGWDGRVTLILDIQNAVPVAIGSDTVVLRVAPPLVASNLWVTTQYHIVNMGGNNLPARTAMQGICAAAGIQYIEVPGNQYGNDRWLQDSSEAAVVQLPANGQPRRVVDQVIQLARSRPVDQWCKDTLLGPDFDFLGRFAGAGTSSHNYGGNFEVVPPYAGKAWGRVMFGGGTGPLLGTTTNVTDNMHQLYKDFFDQALIQGPHLEITSEWLYVGHVDEFSMFIPAPGTARGWVCLIASPTRALNVLQGMQATHGNAPIFAGRAGWETTVNGILGNAAALTLQQQAQARIDIARDQIKAATGLTNTDFVELPTLFEYVSGNYVAAWNPGVVNCVCMPVANGTTYLAIPDPEGPDIGGVDQWRQDILNQLAPLATAGKPFNTTFVDVFYGYHTGVGEIHCGSNFVRTPPSDDWWNK